MKVLLASDGSPNAERAARWLVKLSAEMNVPLTVVVANVHDDAPYRLAMRHLTRDDVERALHDQSTRDVASAKAILEEAGLKPEVRLEIGGVAETLVGLAKREHCTMIVMGQKGRTTFANLLMGSIATRVLSLSEMPVTLVR
jgi:nucleotide-binding universal stress UspA family protein